MMLQGSLISRSIWELDLQIRSIWRQLPAIDVRWRRDQMATIATPPPHPPPFIPFFQLDIILKVELLVQKRKFCSFLHSLVIAPSSVDCRGGTITFFSITISLNVSLFRKNCQVKMLGKFRMKMQKFLPTRTWKFPWIFANKLVTFASSGGKFSRLHENYWYIRRHLCISVYNFPKNFSEICSRTFRGMVSTS